MIKIIISVLALFLQVFLVFNGSYYDLNATPYELLAVSLLIPAYYLYLILSANNSALPAKLSFVGHILGACLGFVSITVAYGIFKKAVHALPNPLDHSDVLPQIYAQYDAFTKGDLPYFPLPGISYHPYPVYMPLHWLPIGFADLLVVDRRWAGFVLLFLAAGAYGFFIARRGEALLKQLIAILLPGFAFYLCIYYDPADFAATFETVIAAYYLLLATGLATRNLLLTTIGLICCLLSRYTLVFWMPLFAILLWLNLPRKKNLFVWLSVLLSVILIYVVPFYLRDPSILTKGIAYHNNAAISDWKADVNYNFQAGIYFAPHMHDFFTGSMEHRVFLARVVQAGSMLFLLLLGLLMYRRWRDRINFYDLGLIILYLVILFFYMFGPLTYRYYYLPLFMLSAVICGRIILTPRRRPNEDS